MINKICVNFETGKKVENVMISLDNKYIAFTRNLAKENHKGELHDITYLPFTYFLSTASDPIFQKYPLLLELQKKLGFNVYGEYVVYSNPENCIVKYFTRKDRSEWLKSFYKKNMIQSNINFYDMDFYLDGVQELSKHYRGEENKFEEVRKVLRI
jgi:hypothetical protein